VQFAIVADSRSAAKKAETVKEHNRTRIAYITGRLITGKRIASFYDANNLTSIEIDSLSDAACLREFDLKYRDFTGVNRGNFQCRYGCEKKHDIALTIKGNTFIGYITGSTAVFLGNVRGDSIHIFDREDSLHLYYRISSCMVDREGSSGICTFCWETQ